LDSANVVEICCNDTFLLSYFKNIGQSKEKISISKVPEVIKTDIRSGFSKVGRIAPRAQGGRF